MDEVLTPKAHHILMAEMIGKEDRLYEIPEKLSSGTDKKLGLEWIVKETVELFAGVPESVLEDTGKKLPIMKGAVKTMKELKKGGYHPILITGGFEQVAGVFARRLGITEWYGNALEIKDGITTGRLHSAPLITLQSKGYLVRERLAHKSSKKKSVAVGNDVNDWAMFQEVGFSILFNPASDLKERLKWYFDTGEKGLKKEFIEFYRSVDVVIEEPDLQLLIPFLIPEPTVSLEKSD
jgi:phosphoserine phosphatase